MDPKTAYLQNQINSATPTGLIVLLYEGLINFALTAKEKIAVNDSVTRREAAEAVDRCIRIVTELNNALHHDHAPELCERLSNLYAFFIAELSRSLIDHDPKIIGDLIPLFDDLKQTWKEAEVLANQATPIPVRG
ncbi:MAG: flagellar export chaperone FliS [Verrucomicrobiota bacterium]